MPHDINQGEQIQYQLPHHLQLGQVMLLESAHHYHVLTTFIIMVHKRTQHNMQLQHLRMQDLFHQSMEHQIPFWLQMELEIHHGVQECKV